MKALLITNDFPPMGGGEATWYGAICASAPPESLIVLGPWTRGGQSFDVRQPYRVIRRRVPTMPHPLARLVQIFLLFVNALSLVGRQRIHALHIGHLYLGPIGLALKHLLHIPYVIYLHGGEMAPYMSFRAVRVVARAVVRNARIVVVNSSYTQRHFEAMGMQHPCTRTLTMGVDVEQFRPDLDIRPVRSKYGLDGAKVMITVGRLIERKGHDIVIRALAQVRQAVRPVRYLVVGSGPEASRLRALARDLGCASEVIFTGHVPRDELPFLYAVSDVFVMPSRALAQRDGVEGFGIAFLEAGACGKPVIGGRSGGIADAVLDGITGLLVDPLDVDRVAAALTGLLLNPEVAARLGMQGRLRAVELQSAWRRTLARIWKDVHAGEERSSDAG